MAVFVAPMLATSFAVNQAGLVSVANTTAGPLSLVVNQAKPSMTNAFGPISAPDIDGRYVPSVILLITY
jgi:hypothetical protein